MINSVVLNGRTTALPDLKFTPNGTPVCDFTLAVKKNYTPEQGEDTDFIRCVAINKIAETIGNHVDKGHLIGIEGSIQTRHFEGEHGRVYVTEVFVKQFHFLEKKENNTPPKKTYNQKR